MRDPELVARAQRAATRLESAWEQWRALHGLAVAPGQPVVSYVGYSLKEPWGEPRVVIGIDADEAEYLAEFLDRDECAQGGKQAPPQQAQLPQVPIRQMPIQQVPLQSGPLQSGPLQQVKLTESAPEGTGEYRVRRFWARQYPSVAAASQRIKPGIWPAGPRVSFPAR